MIDNAIKWGLTKNEVETFKEEYAYGYDNGSRGVLYSNPHKAGTVAYDGWRRGWNASHLKRMEMTW